MSAKRRPTQVDVARLARTSRQTVSLVVRDDPRVATQTRSRVLSAMDELDYRPNIAARALAAHNSRFIGIILVGITNPFYADLCDALRSRCEERGLIPLVAISGRHRDSCIVCAERLVHMGVEGLTVVSPPLGAEDLDRIGTQVPTVLLTHNSGPGSVDLVHTDDETGARMAIRHLLENGFEPVAHLGYDRAIPGDSAGARRRGFLAEARRAGTEPLSVDLMTTTVEDAVRGLLRAHGPGIGFCCHNDLVALEVMRVLADRAPAGGHDHGITGFDNSRIASHPAISLTSIDQRTADLADAAVELLGERIDGRTGQVDRVCAPTLVRRDSSRPRGTPDVGASPLADNLS